MNAERCEQIEPLLVDYADGTLPPPERRRIADHVAGCPRCREELDALARSLELARVVWEGNLRSGSQTAWAEAHPTRRLWPCVAAAALIVLGIGLALHRLDRPSGPMEPELTLAQIERQIFEEASAAKVLAAAELLERKPHASELAEKPYRYVIEHYPQTHAANIARTRIQ